MNFNSPYGDNLILLLGSAIAWTALHCCLALTVSIILGILYAIPRFSMFGSPFTSVAHLLEGVGPLLPAITIVSSLGLTSETIIALVLGLFSWNTIGLFLKEEISLIENTGFVEGAKALGASTFHILFRHVLPFLVPRMVPLCLGLFASYAGLIGALGFLGAGSNSKNSLGFIIFDAKGYYFQHPSYFWGSIMAFSMLTVVPLFMLRIAKTYWNIKVKFGNR